MTHSFYNLLWEFIVDVTVNFTYHLIKLKFKIVSLFVLFDLDRFVFARTVRSILSYPIACVVLIVKRNMCNIGFPVVDTVTRPVNVFHMMWFRIISNFMGSASFLTRKSKQWKSRHTLFSLKIKPRFYTYIWHIQPTRRNIRQHFYIFIS